MTRVSMPISTATSTAVALVPTWVWAQGPSEADKYPYGVLPKIHPARLHALL